LVLRRTLDVEETPDAPSFGDIAQIADRRDVSGGRSNVVSFPTTGSLPIESGAFPSVFDLITTQRQIGRFLKERERNAVLAEQQAAVQAQVRSSPTPDLEGVGLLSVPQIFKEPTMGAFVENIGDLIVDVARETFLPTPVLPFVAPAGAPAGPFPNIISPAERVALEKAGLIKKTRKRRRRLLTCSDRDDITYMKSTLSGPDFKIWLGNPKSFARC